MILKAIPGRPVTLGDLVREEKLLWVYCCDCGRERDADPALVTLPAATTVPSTAKYMKCSSCGSRSTPSLSSIQAE